MIDIIKTEFLKLKRYSVIKAGIIMTMLSPLLSLFYSTANSGQTWTFDYFMQQVMISNCTLFFPIIIALIAGYIITREYTDDTMKNIITIPIPYRQLLSGKLLVLLLLTIYFSFIGCMIAFIINMFAEFPGAHFGNILNMFLRVTGANIGVYVSILPIILLFCCSANNFLGGVAFLLFKKMAVRNGRWDYLICQMKKGIKPQNGESFLTAPLLVALITVFIYMIQMEIF